MRRTRAQQGQVLIWVAILLPVFLVLTGLVFDGGLLWYQYLRARWAASAAAVAAASEIDAAVFAESGQVVLGGDAVAVAAQYATRNAPELHLTRVYVVDYTYVGVDGWVWAEPVFLSIFGVDGFQIAVQAMERPAWGASGEWE